MSRLVGRIARLERTWRPTRGSSGTVEWHYSSGGDISHSSTLIPCDRRDEHGQDCVMSVSPTDGDVRFIRIIEGMEPE